MATTSPVTASEPVDQAEVRNRMMALISNVLLAAIFLNFVISHGTAFSQSWRLSSLLLMIKVSLDMYFALTRSFPKEVSFSPYDWFIGIAGTFASMYFYSSPNGNDLLLGQALQVTGVSIQVLGIMSLNRSFGLVAANRGIKTTGMYGFVRHPLYFSYTVTYTGFLINQFTDWNVLIFCNVILLFVLRIEAEERLLRRDPQYRDYVNQVKYRLIPFVF